MRRMPAKELKLEFTVTFKINCVWIIELFRDQTRQLKKSYHY